MGMVIVCPFEKWRQADRLAYPVKISESVTVKMEG
jgi:hypothetical protein